MRSCDVCGSTKGEIYGKTGKYKMDLCSKHRHHMQKHGKILERTILTPNELIINENIITIVMFDSSFNESGRTLVDTKHYDIITKYKWGLDTDGYATTRTGGKNVGLHRIIMNAPKGLVVDHINHDKLDNREINLRLCTHQENLFNYSNNCNNTSGHKGVHWCKQRNKWVAQIMSNGHKLNLGGYLDINEAIEARNKAEVEIFGEFRYTKEVSE